MFSPDGNDEGAEWVELYNNSEADVDLSEWDLDPDTGNYQELKGKVIKSKDRLTIDRLSGLRNENGQVSLYSSSKHSATTLMDYVQYGNENLGATENKIKDRAVSAGMWPSESYVAIKPTAKLIERISDGLDSNSPSDWRENSAKKPEANQAKKSDSTPSSSLRSYSSAIRINEILPNASEEYIELYNAGNQNEDLFGWILKDASKTGRYAFPENSIIKSADYFTVYKKNFKFALNNSGNETVRLFGPDEREINSVSYSGSQKNVSYNFDGKGWRWSRFATPGEKNRLNRTPETQTVRDKHIYAGVYADFSAKVTDADKDKLKYTWDFGDGHKSYKKEARHKYEKSGKYLATLEVFDGSEDKTESFAVEVKKFPKNKLEIVSVSPNPEGKDSEAEYILIRNKSAKKINLKGWSIATGSKKLYNHPVNKTLVIKPGETKKIKRAASSFTLNNKKSKVELRYPDGQVAFKLKYKSPTALKENVIYAKANKKWQWMASSSSDNNTATKTISASAAHPPSDNPTLAKANLAKNYPINAKPESGSAPEKSAENKMVMKNYTAPASFKNTPPNFSGANSVRVKNNFYIFTSDPASSQHYVIKFLKSAKKEGNGRLGRFFY